VFAGQTATQLRIVAQARKTGFETAISIGSARYVSVQALDWQGRALATSVTVRAG
jgi:hypothetical protein